MQHLDYGSGVQIHVGKAGSPQDSFANTHTATIVNKSDSNGDGD